MNTIIASNSLILLVNISPPNTTEPNRPKFPELQKIGIPTILMPPIATVTSTQSPNFYSNQTRIDSHLVVKLKGKISKLSIREEDSISPSDTAIGLSRRAVDLLFEKGVNIADINVFSMAEGGVSFELEHNENILMIDIYNDGQIAFLKSENENTEPIAFDLENIEELEELLSFEDSGITV